MPCYGRAPKPGESEPRLRCGEGVPGEGESLVATREGGACLTTQPSGEPSTKNRLGALNECALTKGGRRPVLKKK